MTPADRVAEARRLIAGARAQLHLAAMSSDVGPELRAEIAVLARSLDRLAQARRRILARGWARFCGVIRRWP